MHIPDRNQKKQKCCRIGNPKPLHKSEQGESSKPTRLYSFWKTSDNDLADFGVGVSMYFHTLKVLVLILLFSGLLSVPNIEYFSSYAYSFGGQNETHILLKGSALCANQIWEPCPNCTESQWDYVPTAYDRFARSDNGLTFIKVNHCAIGLREGVVNYTTIWFIIISFIIMGRFHSRREIEFDESNQTTSDYSVEVENPPPDSDVSGK